MHHLGVQSNTGSEKTKLGFDGHKHPVCPKPRRLGSAVPEFLKPLKCNKHSHSQMKPEERIGILNIIAEKMTTEGRKSVSCGCSATCYTGSPPGRTDNPLVQDVHFIHQMEPFPPLPPTKLSDKFGFTSA